MLEEDFKEAKKDLVDSVTGLEKSDVSEGSGLNGEKPPKYKDFDEMIEDYSKDDHSKEEGPLKNQQEKAPEKNADGQ